MFDVEGVFKSAFWCDVSAGMIFRDIHACVFVYVFVHGYVREEVNMYGIHKFLYTWKNT
jgi:hypothetical protein